MKPYHYGKETRLQGAQQATAAKRTVSPTGSSGAPRDSLKPMGVTAIPAGDE